MTSSQRLWLSAIVSFLFYAGWSFFANRLVTDDMTVLVRSALVQGIYSGGVTLGFTWLLEHFYQRVGTRWMSFAFMVPVLCYAHSQTKQARAIRASADDLIDRSASWLKGTCLPGVIFSPLIPLTVQSLLVIAVNVVNQTPNLWLTVAPSMVYSGAYGYLYTLSLNKQKRKEQTVTTS